MLDGDTIRRGMDGMAIGEQGAAGIQVLHVGQDGAQDEQAIGLVDEFLHFIAGDESAVDADIERMVFANDGLAEERRGDRHIQALDQARQFVMEPEAAHFGAGQNHRAFGRLQHGTYFIQSFAQRCAVGRFALGLMFVRRLGQRHVHHVARNFEIDRAAIPQQGREGAIHLTFGGDGVFQAYGRHGHFFEDFPLRRKLAHHVVQVGVAGTFRQSGGAGQQHDRRSFRIGAGDGVDGIESADTVGDTEGADPVDARIGVGRKPRTVFPRGGHVLDGRRLHQFVKAEDVVAGDAEHVTDSEPVEPIQDCCSDRLYGHGASAVE